MEYYAVVKTVFIHHMQKERWILEKYWIKKVSEKPT